MCMEEQKGKKLTNYKVMKLHSGHNASENCNKNEEASSVTTR